ncbi:Trimethyllysine dioxygenase [Patellaria atrata CBS 101060]|uniref:Trimethyllysine dioxygenase n=1 Tax=Patellaria atrata CBS 101060 TaxID=1346257 RepID=A0A9P4SKJ5_9PEZI|nr:Trimethyllysine dioxygenase [Patellaria atrata CBS 101060]
MRRCFATANIRQEQYNTNPQIELVRINDRSIKVRDDSRKWYDEVPDMWLRDNCQCNKCVHTATKQRLVETFDIPEEIHITSCVREGRNVKVKWSDGHDSIYDLGWLAASAHSKSAVSRQGLRELTFWTSSVGQNPPEVPYEEVMNSEKGVAQWLDRIRQYGFCYVDGCPPTPEATEKLLERIAFIRNTHYGGFWDFTSDLSSKDTAYTDIALGAHTDTTYFSDPAGLQLFHLLSHTDGSGGESLLVDGFAAADTLKKEDGYAYDTLSEVNVYSHASGNDGISIQPYRSFPVLNHDPEFENLLQVRWNNSDRAAIDLPLGDVEDWYAAARKWVRIINSPKNQYWEQLRPGRPLIFDNWRVLHGRAAFSGKRRLCGGYINRDDFISRYKMLNWGPEKTLQYLAVE